MSNSWIIADTHFGHKNINIYEPIRQTWGEDYIASTNKIIDAWNEVVKPGDFVYHLGDFAMGNPKYWKDYRDRLNGNIILIQGNHDSKPRTWLKSTDVCVKGPFVIPVENVCLHMFHSPYDIRDVDLAIAGKDSIFLYGHVHSAVLSESFKARLKGKSMCVSIEQLPTAPAPMLLRRVWETL